LFHLQVEGTSSTFFHCVFFTLENFGALHFFLSFISILSSSCFCLWGFFFYKFHKKLASSSSMHYSSLKLFQALYVTTLTLGSRPKQRFARAWAKRETRKCGSVRMNIHTPKWVPMLGVGVPTNSWIFIKQFQGSKLISLRSLLYH
jgi:hypothetical protein